MDSSLYKMNINDEDFPPIKAGIQSYHRAATIKLPSSAHDNISPNKETHSPTSNVQSNLNNSMSPIDTSLNPDLLNFTLTPKKKAVSAYHARYLAVSKKMSTPSSSNVLLENESDPSIISRREKQIEYGKSTLAYERYCQQVHKDARTATMPRTPEKLKKYSRRQFDGLIKSWKIRIHEWDLSANGKSLESNPFFLNGSSPNSNSSTSLISLCGETDDANFYENINLEKTSTEKAIEKAIMDWRDEYRVKENNEEVQQFSMVKKFKLGSPPTTSI